jgi:DNA-binding transcriptional MerR regulator
MRTQDTWTIRELADELGLTVRSIRFYEEKGLVKPNARSNGERRVYSRKERTRLKLIARGKHFGMSLEDMANILGGTSADPKEEEQCLKALATFEKTLADLARRKKEIEAMEKEIFQYMGGIRSRLAQIKKTDESEPF